MADEKLETIRKLLAMAEGEGLADEARESYSRKAEELIAKYGIERALLEAKDPAKARAGDLLIAVTNPYAVDKAQLLAYIAQALRCRMVQDRRRGGEIRTHVVGMESDLTRVDLLFTSLLVQAWFGLAAAYVPFGENTTSFRKSWLDGFSRAVYFRLNASEKAAEKQSGEPGTALVLRDRSALVEARVSELYPRLKKNGPRNLSGSGRRAGFAAGQDADLGGSDKLGVSTRGALGA
jgi:hypothetical protein